jgi:hypothetical protein
MLEIVVRGEDGRNGMKVKLTIGTSLPGSVVGVVAVLKFLGRG